MSNFLDQVSNELSSGTETVETVETPVETPTETVEPVDKPSEEVSEKDDKPEEIVDPAPAPAPEQTEPEPQPEPDQTEPTEKHKKDLSGLSKEEKAAFAFKRQLEKQKQKYENEISKMMEQFAAVRKDVDALKNPKPKEEPKTRTDFDSDDDYIKYLNKKGLEEVLAEQKEADAKAQAEREEAERAKREATETFSRNCQQAFHDNEEQYAAFAKKVNKALANKFGEILDEVPAVRDYVFTHPDGPLVLDKMLTDRDAFVRIMSRGNNPIAATIEMYEMAKEIKAAPKAEEVVAEPAAPRTIMPSIGKPGKGNSNTAPDVFGSDQALLDLIRGR